MWGQEKTFGGITLQVKNKKRPTLIIKNRLGKKQELAEETISRSCMLNS